MNYEANFYASESNSMARDLLLCCVVQRGIEPDEGVSTCHRQGRKKTKASPPVIDRLKRDAFFFNQFLGTAPFRKGGEDGERQRVCVEDGEGE
jgi:hypothetical protein